MSRNEEQLAAIREKTRVKILDAAVRVFTRRGFAAASMQDIATEAAISVGLIYRHFTTKEALFGAILKQAADGLAETARLFGQKLPPRQLIQIFTGEIINDLKNSDTFSGFMMLISQAFMTEDFIPEVKELTKQSQLMRKRIISLIKKGQKLGEFKDGDPTALTIYYLSSIQGLAESKFVLQDKFIAPSPETIHAFLIKEEL